MDVVYNHVYEAEDFCYNMLVPKYFSRTNGRGVYSNGSGCGNDTASERSMVSKYIVDSVCYWADEYHIDGFRFDLVGLIDTTTINTIMAKVHEKHPNVIFYGEGWTMDTGVTKPGVAMCTQHNSHMVPQFAFFSDTIRDVLRGSVFDMTVPGFICGAEVDKNILHSTYMGVPFWAQEPTQSINYVSCHDNNTLFDRIMLAMPNASRELCARMNNLAAAFTLTAQGIPFFQAGEEMLRSKPDGKGGLEHNSYASSDAVNSIKWNELNKADVMNTYHYYRGLLKLRKAHDELRLATREEVLETVKPLHVDNPHVVAFGIGKKDEAQMIAIFNGGFDSIDLNLPQGKWALLVNHEKAGVKPVEILEKQIHVEGISAMILEKQA
jgi:pullulanase